MKLRILTAILFLIPSLALGQSVVQSGTVTPGHATRWITNGVVGDAGTAANGSLTSIGTTGGGPTICANSAPITGPYQQLCLSSNTSGAGQITYNPYGGASAQPLQLCTNGQCLTIPTGGGASTIPTIMTPTVTDALICAADPIGNLKDCSGSYLSVSKGGTGEGSFTSGLPLIGSGASPISQGTITGNTTLFATGSGSYVSGHCIVSDASGNFVDGGPCPSGGTVSLGSTNQLAYYPGSSALVAGLATSNYGVLTTNSSGAPSISTTLPNGQNVTKFVSRGYTVQAGPYPTTTSGAANFGPSTGQTSLDLIDYGNDYRIRQDGSVSQVKFYLPATTAITGVYVKIWRQQGTNFDLVGSSANLVGSIAIGTNTISLGASPIVGVKYGDYIGLRIEYASASAQVLNTVSSTDTTIYSVLNATPSTAQYNWLGQTSTATSGVVVEVFMQAPIFVSIGDSITAGYPDGDAFAVAISLSPNNITASYTYALGQQTGFTNQNMGINGNTTTDISARFAADVVAKHPVFVLIEGGVNDIQNGVTNTTILANYTSILNAAIADGEIPVVIGVLPFRADGTANNAMLQQRDLLNASLQTLVTGAPYNGYYVSPDSVGTYYSGGDPNNLWQLVGTSDGLHPHTAENLVLSYAIYQAWLGNAINKPLLPGNVNVNTGFSYSFAGLPFLFGNAANTSVFAGFSAGNLTATGADNTGVGNAAGSSLTTGARDTFIGSLAGQNVTSSSDVVGIGWGAARASGGTTVAIGTLAVRQSTGIDNVGIGYNALNANTNGSENVAIGASTGGNGSNNTFVGSGIAAASTGSNNIGVGFFALNALTSGTYNVAIGPQAQDLATSGTGNVSVGYATYRNATGSYNAALGYTAGINLTTGAQNLCLGYAACSGITTGSYNTVLGNITGLPSGLSNAIILGDGQGNIKLDYNKTVSGAWRSPAQIGATNFQATAIYSAAGTPLPTCNAGAEGTWAAISDATTPTYNGAYTSGGTVHVPVYCDGTGWKTH